MCSVWLRIKNIFSQKESHAVDIKWFWSLQLGFVHTLVTDANYEITSKAAWKKWLRTRVVMTSRLCVSHFPLHVCFPSQLFKGKFYYCVGFDVKNITNKSDCLAANYRWVHHKYNFDNLGQVQERKNTSCRDCFEHIHAGCKHKQWCKYSEIILMISTPHRTEFYPAVYCAVPGEQLQDIWQIVNYR